MHLRRSGLLALTLLLACASRQESPPGASADAGAPPGADASAPTPEDAGPQPPPCEPLEATARAAGVSLSPPRDHHVTFVHVVGGKPYLYVVAGARDAFAEFFDDVLRAPIREDGDLGAFQPAGKLPLKIAGMGLAVVGDRVVLSGGGLPGNTFTTRTFVGTVLGDGSVGDWKEGGELPRAVMHPSSVAVGRDVLVLGGTTGRAATTNVVRARLGEDGSLGAFEAMTALDPPRSHQAAFVHAGRVYVAGGLDRSPTGDPPPLDDIQAAPIGDDGSLGAWAPAGALPVALAVHPAEVVGCHVLVAGGLDDQRRASPFSDEVQSLTLNAQGEITGSVRLRATLSVKRGHVHQLPRFGRHLYVVGGRGNDGASVGAIDVVTLDREPPSP